MVRLGISVLAAFVLIGFAPQENTEATIATGIGKLRSLPDDVRAKRTRELALAIRTLPDGARKVQIASSLANLATEGDFGPGTLQAVADTLTGAVKAFPVPADNGVYIELANLARYEGIRVDLDTFDYKAALASVDALDRARAKADFTLIDRSGKPWTRSALKGKVVVVNFWATWCPPCRKEMPDLDALSARFKDRLVILGISDEKPETVDAYLKAHPVRYTILLDPNRKVNDLYKVDGIPKNLIYDRNGKLVAQSIDMRTMGQFLKLLAKASLE